VVTAGSANAALLNEYKNVPYPFGSGRELLSICNMHGITIAELMWVNERTWRSDSEISAGLQKIWQTMRDCVQRGLAHPGTCPARTRCSGVRPCWRRSCASAPSAPWPTR
jgi:L-serine dehydratase